MRILPTHRCINKKTTIYRKSITVIILLKTNNNLSYKLDIYVIQYTYYINVIKISIQNI